MRVLVDGGDEWMNREVTVISHERRGERALATLLPSPERCGDGQRV